MFNPLTFLKSAKGIAITVAVTVALSTVGLLWFQKNQAEKKVVELQIENSNLQAAVLKKEIEVGGLKIAMDVLQDTYKELADAIKIEGEIAERIENAPPESDGPVAPVLRDTLDALGRVHGNASN